MSDDAFEAAQREWRREQGAPDQPTNPQKPWLDDGPVPIEEDAFLAGWNAALAHAAEQAEAKYTQGYEDGVTDTKEAETHAAEQRKADEALLRDIQRCGSYDADRPEEWEKTWQALEARLAEPKVKG